jgi:hypothetical protein
MIFFHHFKHSWNISEFYMIFNIMFIDFAIFLLIDSISNSCGDSAIICTGSHTVIMYDNIFFLQDENRSLRSVNMLL